MKLSNKYNIPQETVDRMVKDGIIPCSVVRHNEIYNTYCAYKEKHPWKSNSEIYLDLSQTLKMSESSIKKIVMKLR